jgi:hypothetical protein
MGVFDFASEDLVVVFAGAGQEVIGRVSAMG